MAIEIYQLHLLIHMFISAFVNVDCEYVYRTEYIDVLLDHFTFTDERTFKLRYLINDTYWEPEKGPIFFYPGNEGDVSEFAQNTGFLNEAAVVFNALILFAEHRYYGDSLPFGNKTLDGPEYFGYLTTAQVLADFVDLIYHIQGQNNEQHSLNENHRNPVIAMGGSYGGELAAYMRIKYPHVIEGALAASAPFLTVTDTVPCNGFILGVTSSFNSSSPQCVNNIRNSWTAFDNITSTDSGKTWISENFKLCTPIKTTDDVSALTNWIEGAYTNTAMCNYPYATNFVVPLPANPVAAMCQYLTNPDLDDKNLLLGIKNAVGVYFNNTGTASCLDWKTDIFSKGSDQDTWILQSCYELTTLMCNDGNTDMFMGTYDGIQYRNDSCYETYKVHQRTFVIEKMYGIEDLRATSNIIFSNGLLDPWKYGGLMYTTNPKITVVIIKDAAHHLDLRASNAKDPISVIKARSLYLDIFQQWIDNFYTTPDIIPPTYF